MARPRGTSSIFQMKGNQIWWIKYYKPKGEPIQESSHSDTKAVAKELRKQRFLEMGKGIDPAAAGRLTYEDIRKSLLDHYAKAAVYRYHSAKWLTVCGARDCLARDDMHRYHGERYPCQSYCGHSS